jgi:glutaredoxin
LPCCRGDRRSKKGANWFVGFLDWLREAPGDPAKATAEAVQHVSKVCAKLGIRATLNLAVTDGEAFAFARYSKEDPGSMGPILCREVCRRDPGPLGPRLCRIVDADCREFGLLNTSVNRLSESRPYANCTSKRSRICAMRRPSCCATLVRDGGSKGRRHAMMVDQKEVLVYVCHRSWRCWLTRRLLQRRGYHFQVIDTTGDAQLCSWLEHFTGRKTKPYVFVDHRPVGGFGEIRTLESSGALEYLVRDAV